MNPSTDRHPIAALARPKPMLWAAAFAVGVYLGYVIASSVHASGFGAWNAFIAGGLALAILFVVVVLAVILALAPDRSGRPAARGALVGGALLAGGVGLGWTISPIIWPDFRAPVILEAPGTVNLSLDELDGYAGGVLRLPPAAPSRMPRKSRPSRRPTWARLGRRSWLRPS